MIGLHEAQRSGAGVRAPGEGPPLPPSVAAEAEAYARSMRAPADAFALADEAAGDAVRARATLAGLEGIEVPPQGYVITNSS